MNDKLKSEIVDFTKRLIQTKSIHTNEESAAKLLKHKMNKLNFTEVEIDSLGNVIGKLPGRSSKDNSPILFDFHLDTVRAKQERWKYDPFGGKIKNEKIYGRGSVDMKGALASALFSLNHLFENRILNNDIYFSGSVCEELHEGACFEKVLKKVEPYLVIIGESSNCNLMIGQKGRAEINLLTKGKSAHTANPKEGINAVMKMTFLLNELKNIELPNADQVGIPLLELTDICSKPYPGHSVIPSECQATCDRRVILDETPSSIKSPIKDIFTKLKNQDSNFNAEVTINNANFTTYTNEKVNKMKFMPAWYFSENRNFVKKAFNALENVGLKIKTNTYSFCTNGSMSAGHYNIKTLGFGPGVEERAHTKDEFIKIRELIDGAKGYYALGDKFT